MPGLFRSGSTIGLISPARRIMESAPSKPDRRTLRKRALILAVLLASIAVACGVLFFALYHSAYPGTENSFFSSAFVRNRKVLVLIPHEDDEINLAYGVIDSFEQAGGDVTVAFETNGDAKTDPDLRVGEAVRTTALMGVPGSNLVFLGYGDHVFNPPLYKGDPDAVRTGDAGRSRTYGAAGYTDFHTKLFGEAAECTLANAEADLRRLIRELRPDVIFVNDTDDHVDHVSLSMIFDAVMGKLLREESDYRPLVFKGFAYDYAWHGNEDFYRIPLLSAKQPWQPDSYSTCYAWNERVRFVMPGEYLSYTLRASKLRALLGCYRSQNALAKEANLLNGDKVFWERRTDNLALSARVTATSGDAVRLTDFVLQGYSDDPLYGCWFPEPSDPNPTIRFQWNAPQDIGQLVFYDAPAPAGDIRAVRVSVNGGQPVPFALPDGTGKPCRMELKSRNVTDLSVEIDAAGNGETGLFEIEVLPARNEETQWIKLTDTDDNFCYELPCAAGAPFTLSLYGYPHTPADASAELWRGGKLVAYPTYENGVFQIPALDAGRYTLRVTSGNCTDEAVLRVGVSMVWQRGLQWLERRLDGQ